MKDSIKKIFIFSDPVMILPEFNPGRLNSGRQGDKIIQGHNC
jgi:hypothetical protein